MTHRRFLMPAHSRTRQDLTTRRSHRECWIPEAWAQWWPDADSGKVVAMRSPSNQLTRAVELTPAALVLLLACSGSAKAPGTKDASTDSGTTNAGDASGNAAETSSGTSTTAASASTDGGSSTSSGGATTSSDGQTSTSSAGASTSAETTTGEASTTVGGASTTATSTDGSPMGTSGCGSASWPEGGAQTLDVDGTTREFISAIPDGYDANAPHRLVFAFHGRTGTAEQIASGFNGGYYGLENRMADTLFVAPQGLGTDEDPADTGWPNTDGQDIAFVEAMLDYFESNYCVDSSRIFSTGFSYGGIMSNTIACQLGSRFRAVAPMAGALFSFGQNSCVGEPVAAWFTHGSMDDQVGIEQGESARDALLDANGCSMTDTEPVDPSPCVSYLDCLAGYPVHWCQTDLNHNIPDFAADAVASFFLGF